MRHRCGTACFVVFLVFSLLLYVAELALQAWMAYGLFKENQHVWFAILIGLLTVPLLTTQLISVQWAWPVQQQQQQQQQPIKGKKKTPGPQAKNGIMDTPVERSEGKSFRCLTALPHLLGVAVPWRYSRLILTCGRNVNTQKELAQICLLRVFLAFSCTLPVMLLETYLLLANPIAELTRRHFILYCPLGVSLFSVCWSLATHRKRSKDYHFLATLISWPGTVFRVTWRLGEITARLLVLALFAGLHSYWIFLVLALHWLTMILWSLTENLTGKGTLSGAAARRAFMSSYIHIFCYLNTGTSKARVRLVLFYVMMSLENAVLLVLWFLYDTRTYLHIPVAVIVGGAYVFAFISAILYYNCFHVKSARVVQRGAEVMYMQPCMSCRPVCCYHNKRTGVPSPTDTFHPAWWIEVKESNSNNNFDMLLPSELKHSYNGGGKRSGSGKTSKTGSGAGNKPAEEVRYWEGPQQKESPPGVGSLYETLTQFQKQQLGVARSSSAGGQRYENAPGGGAVVSTSQRTGGQENAGFAWDDYIIRGLAQHCNHLEGCLDPACQGRCLSNHLYPHHPHQISDSGISATTTNTSTSENHSGSRGGFRSDDISLLYTSDTSDLTSTRTSLSYLDPHRIHRLSMLRGEDDWSMTSSSFGLTSGESARDLSMYLPMLTHLNSVANAKGELVPPSSEQLISNQQEQQLEQPPRSPAPLPPDAGESLSIAPGGAPVVPGATSPTPDVHYDHVPSNMSQTDGRGRRMRIRMGRNACYAHRKGRRGEHAHHRRRANSSGSSSARRTNQHRRAVPCGVAGKLHRRRHSDASDTMCSRSSLAASTTDSYDGSLSDWADLSDRASCSLQLPGTQSDLDFSVCGDYPYTVATSAETENEYVEPTPANQIHLSPQQIKQQLTPKIIQKLDESGNQIGFVC